MTSPTQPKPIPAILVYGAPTNLDLTQACWFRVEDKQAAKAAAEALKFSVIDIQTEAERALLVGVHEGVLKGSGRMIIGSLSPEVYRRIEDYAREASTPRCLAQAGQHRDRREKIGARTKRESDYSWRGSSRAPSRMTGLGQSTYRSGRSLLHWVVRLSTGAV